jgi:hypothetical protein
MRGPIRRTVIALAVATIAFTLLGAPAAWAAVRINENAGVGAASLGNRDSVARRALGRCVSGVDTSYEKQTVYYFYFGKRMRNKKYPLEMYSNRSHRVFTFVVNSPSYATAKGIGVGSRERTLTRAYGSALRHAKSSVYTRYYLGGRTGTDFWVRNGAVTQIVIRTY